MNWRLSYGKFLLFKRRFELPTQRFSTRVLFVYGGEPLGVAWLKPTLLKYQPYRLTATFELGEKSEIFVAGSYYPKAEAFVVDLKPQQAMTVAALFPGVCLQEVERAEWAKKIQAGKEVPCPELSGFSWV